MNPPVQDFIEKLRPADSCPICGEEWKYEHQPVALPCRHILGHDCLVKWLETGEGNISQCPSCRAPFLGNTQSSQQGGNNAQGDMADNLDEDAEAPILLQVSRQGILQMGSVAVQRMHNVDQDPEFRFYEKYQYATNSMVQIRPQIPNVQHPENVRLVTRLRRPVALVGALVPQPMLSDHSFQELMWNANIVNYRETQDAIVTNTGVPLDLLPGITWAALHLASESTDDRLCPMLQLFTVMASHHIETYRGQLGQGNHTRHFVSEFLQKDRLGERLIGEVSHEFMTKLGCVYAELWRHQHGMGRSALRGANAEKAIIQGLWQASKWQAAHGGYATYLGCCPPLLNRFAIAYCNGGGVGQPTNLFL